MAIAFALSVSDVLAAQTTVPSWMKAGEFTKAQVMEASHWSSGDPVAHATVTVGLAESRDACMWAFVGPTVTRQTDGKGTAQFTTKEIRGIFQRAKTGQRFTVTAAATGYLTGQQVLVDPARQLPSNLNYSSDVRVYLVGPKAIVRTATEALKRVQADPVVQKVIGKKNMELLKKAKTCLRVLTWVILPPKRESMPAEIRIDPYTGEVKMGYAM